MKHEHLVSSKELIKVELPPGNKEVSQEEVSEEK